MAELINHAELLEESIRRRLAQALMDKSGEDRTIETMAAFCTQLALELRLTTEQVEDPRFWEKLTAAIKTGYWLFLQV